MDERTRKAFRRTMRRGIDDDIENAYVQAVGIAALLTWAGAILYLLGLI